MEVKMGLGLRTTPYEKEPELPSAWKNIINDTWRDYDADNSGELDRDEARRMFAGLFGYTSLSDFDS